MEGTGSSEMSVYNKAKQRHIPGDCNLQNVVLADIIVMVKSISRIWTEHAACMEEKRNTYGMKIWRKETTGGWMHSIK
jgi:hypothetical protein